jgi:hypothetical protein
MNDIQTLIDKARQIVQPHSYYEVARRLGIATQTLSRVRNRGGTLDNEAAVKLAALLGQPELDVIALMERERAKTPEKKAFWESRLPRGMPVVAYLGIITGVTCVTAKAYLLQEVIRHAIHYAQYLYMRTGQTAYGLGRYAPKIGLQG